MAYMFRVATRCQFPGCTKLFTHRVCNRINDTMGNFCEKHAKARLTELQAVEDRILKSRTGAGAPPPGAGE